MDVYEKSKKLALSHEKLYHYTNFEALEKILTNMTLRATRLDLVDDETENQRIDEFWKEKLFVVCFTHDEANEQKFWDNYTTDNQGVRLEFEPKTLQNLMVYLDEKCEKKLDYINRSDLQYNNKDDWGYIDISMLDVVYVDDLYEGVVYDEDFSKLTHNDKTGFAKLKSYSWENETRMRVALRPKGFENIMINKDFRVLKPNFEHIYIKITEEMLKSMRIILNPNADIEMKNQVESLCNKLNLNHIFVNQEIGLK